MKDGSFEPSKYHAILDANRQEAAAGERTKTVEEHVTEPIWDMTIEDLMAMPPEKVAQAISGPFIINLVSALTPVHVPSFIPGLELQRVYQLSRIENERPRYRLRIGFFSTWEDAETALAKLRERYPSAFIASPGQADARYAPAEIAAHLCAPPAVADTMPNRIIGEPPPPPLDESMHDSTLTQRDLTAAEIAALSGPKWFAVELDHSERPINLQTLPQLDIFAEYRLYTVISTEGGKEMHTLRLGFFSEEPAAEAVAAYVSSFFGTPAARQVSAAEHERFAERRPKAMSQTHGKATATPSSGASDTVSTSPRASNGAHPVATPRPSPTRSGPNAAPASRATLGELFREKARQVLFSESAIRRLPAADSSLWAKLFGQTKG